MAAIMLRSVDALRMASERARFPAAVIAENQRAGGSAGNVKVALLRAANWLRFAAAPTFVVMALLVAVVGRSLPNALCGGARDGLRDDCQGEYREVVPERKLLFTWAWASTSEQRSLVTVDLRAAPGGAELVFTHTQSDDETTRDDHRRGWNSAFDKLEALFAQPAEGMSHGTA
jgi:hypothetical protein